MFLFLIKSKCYMWVYVALFMFLPDLMKKAYLWKRFTRSEILVCKVPISTYHHSFQQKCTLEAVKQYL